MWFAAARGVCRQASICPSGHTFAISCSHGGPGFSSAGMQTCSVVFPPMQPSTPFAHRSAISFAQPPAAGAPVEGSPATRPGFGGDDIEPEAGGLLPHASSRAATAIRNERERVWVRGFTVPPARTVREAAPRLADATAFYGFFFFGFFFGSGFG